MALFVTATSILRFKMIAADGRVFYSTRPGDIGKTVETAAFRQVVAGGEVLYATATAPARAFAAYRTAATPLPPDSRRLIAEVYVPVMSRGRFAGAVEFYTDITDMLAEMKARVRSALVAFALAGLALAAAALFWLSASNRRRLQVERARAEREKRLLEDQMRVSREVRLLSELNEWLQSSRSLDELFHMVGAFMERLLPGCPGAIYVYSNSRDVLDGACAWTGGQLHDHIRPESCWALRRGRTYAYGQSEIDFVCGHVHDHDGRAYYCFPILAHGETVGLMTLFAGDGQTAEEFAAIRKLAQMCAEQISLAIANVRMRDQLHHQSIRDPLTGLYNRRHFTESLRDILQAAGERGLKPAIVSIDVDHFKTFNDTHGHDAGDIVLRAVAEAMDRHCVQGELPCRIGGEEFMILLAEGGREAAVELAEALRRDVAALKVRYGGKTLPTITISLGVAAWPGDGRTPQELMKAADNALYEAKAKGRNRTCLAGRGEAPIPASPLDGDKAKSRRHRADGRTRGRPAGPNHAVAKPAPRSPDRDAGDRAADPAPTDDRRGQDHGPPGSRAAGQGGTTPSGGRAKGTGGDREGAGRESAGTSAGTGKGDADARPAAAEGAAPERQRRPAA